MPEQTAGQHQSRGPVHRLPHAWINDCHPSGTRCVPQLRVAFEAETNRERISTLLSLDQLAVARKFGIKFIVPHTTSPWV